MRGNSWNAYKRAIFH